MSSRTSLVLSLVLFAGRALAKAPEPAAPELVPFASPESEARLARSKAKVDFFRLANHFESQQNLGYCGPASSTIVLNTLRADDKTITKPRDEALFPAEFRKGLPPGLDPVFARYTQSMFFDDATATVKTREQFFGKPKAPGLKPSPGLELRELAGILAAHGLATELRVADDKLTDATIHRELVANLSTPDDYVLINYFRPVLGQTGGGHISPLGAYDEKSDSFLILDVNPNGHTWVWVPSSRLIAAMRTPDAHENRGYVLVREGAKNK
ncbi:MAG TPA: phytochelatin synthase family protein [Polyangia bacterium]|nr:phytochelatin synthase family protein [Polyangia bacterium]